MSRRKTSRSEQLSAAKACKRTIITGIDRIYIACGYTVLRQGIDGLCAVIRRQLDEDLNMTNGAP